MKKKLQSLFFTVLVMTTMQVMGQYRYYDEMFSDVTVQADVKYGENYSVLTGAPVLEDLLMDVYMPTGDTETKRPLIILAHSGSYLPKGLNQLPFGTRKDSAIIEMCTRLAKRGWVAVAMSYRLGWNPLAPDQEGRAGTIMNAVYRSAQDMHTCIRYFKEDAYGANMYMVDTTKIAVGGTNSGAYTALAAGYLDKVEEINLFKFQDSTGASFINQAITGGFYGEGGAPGVNNYSNPGHTSDIKLVLNMGGAIGDTSWMEQGDIPVVSFHGVNDFLTPYGTAVVIVASTGQPIVEVSGSHDLSRYANSLGLNQPFVDVGLLDPYTDAARNLSPYEGLFPFVGAADGFEPWAWYDPADPNTDHTTPGATGYGSKLNPYASPQKARTFIDTIMGYFAPRADAALNLDSLIKGIRNAGSPGRFEIYPNPVRDLVTIRGELEGPYTVNITSLSGQTMHSSTRYEREFRLDISSYPKGVYLLSIGSRDRVSTRKLIKL